MLNEINVRVSGHVHNMQYWYVENLKLSLLYLASLSDLLFRLDEKEKVSDLRSEVEYHIESITKCVLAMMHLTHGTSEMNVELFQRQEIDSILKEGKKGYEKIMARMNDPEYRWE